MIRGKLLSTVALGGAGYAAYRSGTDTLLTEDLRQSAGSTVAAIKSRPQLNVSTLHSTPVPRKSPVKHLPAYDTPEPPVYLVAEEPSDLQRHIGYLRRGLNDRLIQADGLARDAVGKVVEFEHDVERNVRKILPSRDAPIAAGAVRQTPGRLAPVAQSEPLLPNALYVAVAGMTGSILARRRNILVRFTLPVALFYGSARYLLPQTTRNLGDLIYSYEAKVPAVRQLHDDANKQLDTLVKKSVETVEDGKHVLEGALGSSKKAFEDASGIKLPRQ